METTSPTTTEKECKGSGLDGSSFSDLPKKPSPSAASRGTTRISQVKPCNIHFTVKISHFSKRDDYKVLQARLFSAGPKCELTYTIYLQH